MFIMSVCECVCVDPDVVSVIIRYVLCVTAWAQMAGLFGLIESVELSRNNSQTVE